MTKDELVTTIRSWQVGDKPLNLSKADLSKANLSKANLPGADLYRADLREADLYMADLYRANLYMANLSGAYLSGTALHMADLRGANLYRANLYMANLSGADLYMANLSGADLSKANLSEANLRGADLDHCTMNWQSNNPIGWRLYNAAITTKQQGLASFVIIGHKDNWCWDKWLAYAKKKRNRKAGKWALALMRSWVKDGDGAPDILKGTEKGIENG